MRLFSLTAASTGKRGNLRGHASFRKLHPSKWGQEQHKSFEQLKKALLETVILAHPDFGWPFILFTDASQDGLGTVLSQVKEGESKACPIAFVSKALTRTQEELSCTSSGVFGVEVLCL